MPKLIHIYKLQQKGINNYLNTDDNREAFRNVDDGKRLVRDNT